MDGFEEKLEKTRVKQKPEEEKRLYIVGFRLKRREYTELMDYAEKRNMSMSDVMREALKLYLKLHKDWEG